MMVAVRDQSPDIELFGQLEWDIYLSTNNQLKCDVLTNQKLDGDVRRDALLEQMPRFIWRTTAYLPPYEKEDLALDLIFDTTDIEQGSLFVSAIAYDKQLFEFLRDATQNFDVIIEDARHPVVKTILDFFSQELPS